MLKTIAVIFFVFILLVTFITPLRNSLNNLFDHSKAELDEKTTLGSVYSSNPRVKEMQQVLQQAGFKPGAIDGKMGEQTRMAIKEFQKQKGLKPTGKIDTVTKRMLDKEKKTVKTPKVKSEPDTPSSLTLPITGKEEYLETKNEEVSKITIMQDEVMSYRLKSKSRIKQIQTALKEAGFYKGEIDGKAEAETERAIKAFQKSKGLDVDGIVGPKTWAELNKYIKN